MRHLVKLSITITLLYANVAAITRPVAVQVFHLPGLPLPRVLFDAFHIFGVFWYWESVNRDVVLTGEAEHESGRGTRVVQLDAREYFPFSRGERLTRIWAERSAGGLPTMTREEAARFLARKIKARWNRANPGWRLVRLRVEERTWPRSERGYEAEKTPASATHVWYAD